MKCIASFLLIFSFSSAFSGELAIEHQIRLCDSKENILQAFDKDSLVKKKMEIFYLETGDLFFSKNFLSIRFRVKEQKVEVTVKKRMKSNVVVSGNEVCEYDLHGGVMGLTCKVDREIELSDFEKLKANNISYQEILNKSQLKLLESIELPKNIFIYGTLAVDRYSFKDMTLDLVHVKGHDEVTYHEISKRYLKSNESVEGVKFEEFVEKAGIKKCTNQLEWDISKFNVLEKI